MRVSMYTFGNVGLMSKRNKYYALCDGVLVLLVPLLLLLVVAVIIGYQ